MKIVWGKYFSGNHLSYYPRYSNASTAVIHRNILIFLKQWRSVFFEYLIQPSLYLLAFGYYLGQLLLASEIKNYTQFVFVGLVLATAASTAVYEAANAVAERIRGENYKFIFQTAPVHKLEIVFGEFIWSVLSSLLASSLFLVIGLFANLIYPHELLPIILYCLYLSVFFVSLSMLVASYIFQKFSLYYFFNLTLIPLFLFSGTFFKVELLPELAAFIFKYLPLGFSIFLLRDSSQALQWHEFAIIFVHLVMAVGFLFLANKRLSSQV